MKVEIIERVFFIKKSVLRKNSLDFNRKQVKDPFGKKSRKIVTF